MSHSEQAEDVVQMLSKPSEVAWKYVIEFWSTCDHVYSGPAGPDGVIVPAYHLAQLVPTHLTNSEELLVSGLTHANPIVVAYCIVSLAKLYHDSGHFLPHEYADKVRDRTEVIDETFGCFGSTTTVARLAQKHTDNYGVQSSP
jgi:hypothetical protein